ncbi:hypothetical protein RUMCAL_00459 [Ruminococcus callidus ATCC 27760]|uniref:Uncharacterized protein n=1 Tax=Ruminococcus callidus ATCC 27760 TaxID=411473 RepID=U2KF90_9FIRM|nr:hypothetical protein RUMCAL_00459 [Ruminococcus callidus ATCC 27760]
MPLDTSPPAPAGFRSDFHSGRKHSPFPVFSHPSVFQKRIAEPKNIILLRFL